MNLERLIETLEKRAAGRNWKALAAEIGISESFLSRVRAGINRPGPRILVYLGLCERIEYVRLEPKTDAKVEQKQ